MNNSKYSLGGLCTPITSEKFKRYSDTCKRRLLTLKFAPVYIVVNEHKMYNKLIGIFLMIKPKVSKDYHRKIWNPQRT